MCALGRELVWRGHRVLVAAAPEIGPAARAAGLDFALLGAAEYPPGALEHLPAELGRRRGRDALRYTLDMVFGLTRVLLRDAQRAFRSPDADRLLFGMAA